MKKLIVAALALLFCAAPPLGSGTAHAQTLDRILKDNKTGQLMTSVTFNPMTIYPLVALLYFLICWPLALASGMLERRIGVGSAGRLLR